MPELLRPEKPSRSAARLSTSRATSAAERPLGAAQPHRGEEAPDAGGGGGLGELPAEDGGAHRDDRHLGPAHDVELHAVLERVAVHVGARLGAGADARSGARAAAMPAASAAPSSGAASAALGRLGDHRGDRGALLGQPLARDAQQIGGPSRGGSRRGSAPRARSRRR